MIPELRNLNTEELELLIKAPLLVSILIAGADGNIDRSEINGAIVSARKKAKGSTSLKVYYESVSEDFEDKLKVLVQTYPKGADQRGAKISDELTGLNSIFKKVQGGLSAEIYDSLKSLALSTAKSSGGLFGLKSIGPEEAKYVDLNMIYPPSASR